MIRWPGMGTSPVCTPSACLTRLRLYVPSVALVGTMAHNLNPGPRQWCRSGDTEGNDLSSNLLTLV